MTFNELAEYINKCVTGNTLTLVMEDSVNETVIPLFMKSGVSISVSNAIVSVNTDFITVTGALSLAPLNGGALFHCVMRFEIRSGKFWLSINLTTEETVGLDKLFGGLNPIVASAEGEVQAVNGVLDGLSVIKPQIYVDSDTVSRELPFTLEASVSFKGNNTLWSQYAAWPKLMTVMTASFTLFYPSNGSGQDRVRFSARIPIVSGALPNGFFNGIVKSGSLAITLDSPVKSILDAGDYMMVGLMCEVNLKNMNTPIAVSSPLFRGDGIWFFETAFLDGLSIADTAKFIMGLFGVEGGLELPAFAVLDNFRLYTLQFTFWGDAPYPNHTLVNIATSSPWKLPIPFVTIDMVRIEWGIIREGNIYTGSGKNFAMTADIFMKITIEITKNLKLKMSAQAQLPSFDIEGSLQLTSEDDPVRLMDLFGTDAGNALGKENAKSTLAQLDVFASPRNKNLSVTSTLNDVLSFDIGNVTLTVETVRAALTLASAGNAFEVFGDINFALEPNAFTIGIGGGYSQGSWHFYGELTSGQINIYTLLLAFLGVDYRGERGGIIITAFKLSYDTKGEFLIEAAFQDDFGLKIGNIAVGLGGFIAVRRANAETSVSAMLFLSVGMFQISVQADDFHDQLKLIFQVSLGNKALRATYAETTREGTLHKEISVELVNTSLGDIVVMLINVINPNHRYELPSPFSVLNRIDLSRLRLVYDLTDESVCFTYRADLNVAGLMYLESVGLKYAKAPGEATKSLRFIIKAKPLTETDTKEYSWDAIKGAPPDIANKPIFKLHYMGVGQNVGNESLLKADTITQAIDALKQGFKEDTVFFDSRIHWLFGLDFTINGTINAKLVFNDPMLYGILITVEPNHSALEAFGGLSLELLYKKITNDIGMFNATLTLPTKFRKLNFGAVSVTIGTLSASIYTNGDFLIDLGFPHNDDFSRSFYVEVAQFTGCGGVYFGKLSGATAVGLPVTNRGVFNTVVKLGVGLAFGIGRTFDFGIVSGGLLLQVVGIFEGIFADFKPHGGGKGEMYYSVQATVGIIGRIYLSVDLKILVIRASVELKAFAKVTLTAHRPGLIHLSVSLTMSASIKILFIKINFSFKFSRTFRFEIGSGSPAPWSSVPHLEKTYINLDHFKAESLGRVTKIHLMFVPLLSIPDSVNDTDSYTCLKYGHASAETANSGADTIYCAAFIPTVSLTDYALFYNMLLDWTLLAWNTEIDRDSARNLTFDTVHAIVDYDRLREFFGINLKISLNSDVSYGGINESSDFDGAILPVPPPIRLTFIMPGEDGDSQNDLTVLDVNYDADNLVTSEYAEEIAKYFESLDPNPESASSGAKSNETGINEQATVIEEAPLAQIVFLDYAHMVLREIIGRLHSCFNEFSLDSAEVLVCERLSGVSLSRVICDNPDLPLVPMDTSIKNCRYTVLENDTVTTIAAKLCVTADSLFDEMKDLAGIVMMGTQFTLNAMIYSNSRNTMSVKQAGAFFFSRRHEFALTGYYPQITEKILLDNPQITLDFEETLNDANTIKLPDGKIWYTHVGDTPERIAKMAALTVLAPGTLPEWDVYLAAFISANGGDGDKTPLNITVPSETLAVIGDNTLSALLRRVCPATKGELYTANILKAYARIEVTRCVAIKDGDTIETLIKSSGAAVDDIAVALLENQAAIKPGKTLVLKNVPKLSKALVKSTLCTDAVSAELAAASSRFMLQGLRLPNIGQDIQNNNETTPYYKIMLLQADLPKLNRDYALKAVSTDAESFVNGAFESALPWSTIEPSLPAPAFDFKTYLRKFSVLDAASTVKKSYTSNLYFNMLSETEDPARLNFPSRDMLLDMPYFDKVEKFDGGNALPVSYFEVLVTRTKSGNDVEVQGVAAAERDRLLGVAKSIRAGSFKQSLLFMANPLQYEHTFIENDFDTDKCVFMRSNLSLETHRAPVFSAYALTNKARRDVCTLYSGEFAMMLWECSVVGGSGYYLRLLNKSGNPLPEDAFDERGQAKLIFVVYDDNQYALTKQSLSNAVVTKPSTDGDDMVFVSKTASDSRLLTSVASMPPGCVGFTIEMEKPPEDSSPLSHTRELYNILEYFIEGESLREDLPNSPPLLPTDSDSESLWQYSAVIPTHKLIKDGENVFDAVGGKLNVRARLRDVLGNRADGALYLRDIPILYNDTLINISTWPNTSLQFDVSLEDGKRYITVVLTSFEKDTKKDLNPSIDLLRHAVLQLKSDMQLEFTTTLFDCTWTVETSQLTTYADKLIKYLSGETPDLPECTWKFEIQGDQSGQNAAPLRYTFKDKGANEILFESDAGVLNEASNKTASDSPYQLCVTLRSYRTKHLTPYTDFNEYRCTIAPNIKAGDTAAQVAFAKSFETAFPHLKLALGGENDSQIYIVPGSVIGSIKIKPVSINVQDTAVMAPCFTSIRPLSNKRVSRTVSVNALNDDGTLSDISADVNYFNVDMDLMAQRFIGDFEQFLDSNAARWATTRLQGLITAKEKLAKAISKQLTQVAKGFSAATELPRNILNDRLKHSLLAGERLACIAEYALTMNAKSRVRLPVQLNPSEEQSQKEKVLHAKAGKIDSAEKSFCIMYSSDILAHSGFDAKFSFTLPELEYDIVADENGYERSKWLRFILPIEKDTRFIDIDFDMRSDIQVPNPLRNCPIEPSLLGHNCVFDYEQLYNFKYELYMNAEIFEQDTYHIDVFYKNVFSACKGQARDLFSELCRYDYVREKLSEAMSSDNNATLANAVSVFAGFVDSVSAMWEIHTGKDIKSGSGDGYKLLSADVNAEFDKQGAHMRVNSDRKGVSARFEGAAVPGMGAPFTLSVEELNVYDYYRLASSAFTVRNSNLLRLNDEVNLDVNECFIYRSGTVTLPFINTGRVISKEILVGTFGEDTFLKELPSALEHLFVALGVEKRGLPVELAVSLSFSSEEFEVELPIGLFPASSDMSVLKSRLVEGITQWYALSAPAFGQLRLYLKAEISAKLESATLITFSRLRVDF